MARAGAGGGGVAGSVSVTDLEKIAGVVPDIEASGELVAAIFGKDQNNDFQPINVQSSIARNVRATLFDSGLASGIASETDGRAAGAGLFTHAVAYGLDPESGERSRYQFNNNLVLLASLVRSATNGSAIQANQNFRGLMAFLDITAVPGVGGLRFRLQGIDPITNAFTFINDNTSLITTVGSHVIALYPGNLGLEGDLLQVNDGVLPTKWAIQVVHTTGDNYTYSANAVLLL